MRKCKNCKYFSPYSDKPKRGKCTNPRRNDLKLVYYFGSHKETDYCALYARKEKKHDNC